MRATRVFTMLALAATLGLAGCDKKGDSGKAAGKAGDKKGASTKAGDNGGLPALSAGDLFKDASSLKGAAIMKKYGKGVVVHGKVLRTITEANGSMAVWLDTGDGKWISLKFADKGEAAKKKAALMSSSETTGTTPFACSGNEAPGRNQPRLVSVAAASHFRSTPPRETLGHVSTPSRSLSPGRLPRTGAGRPGGDLPVGGPRRGRDSR